MDSDAAPQAMQVCPCPPGGAVRLVCAEIITSAMTKNAITLKTRIRLSFVFNALSSDYTYFREDVRIGAILANSHSRQPFAISSSSVFAKNTGQITDVINEHESHQDQISSEH
jgi:hypothetical protein